MQVVAPFNSDPNWVSSDARDRRHAIAPIDAAPDPAATWSRLVRHMGQLPRFQIEEQSDRYLHGVARTLLGFRDDVEFLLRPEAGEIAVRSASRVGRWDLGANRRRIERIRRALKKNHR